MSVKKTEHAEPICCLAPRAVVGILGILLLFEYGLAQAVPHDALSVRSSWPVHSGFCNGRTGERSGKQLAPDKKLADTSEAQAARAAQLRSTSLALIKRATQPDLALAARQLTESARLYQTLNLYAEAAVDYVTLGEIYVTWGQNTSALAIYRKALSLSRHMDKRVKCSLVSHMALAYVVFGYVDQARQSARQAELLASQVTDREAKAEASVASGIVLFYSKDSLAALQRFRNAAEMFKSIGNHDQQAYATRWEGLASFSLGSSADAMNEQLEALRLWQDAGDVYGIARAEAALGMLRVALGDFDTALAAYQEAEPIFRSIGDRENEAVVLNGLGLVSQEIGDFEHSLMYFTKSGRIFASLRDKLGEVGALDGAAQAQCRMHRYGLAQSLYAEELVKAQQLRNGRLVVSALSNLGDIYEQWGSYPHAQSFYLRSLALSRVIRHSYGETEVLIRLGHLYAETVRYDLAIQTLNQALKLSEATEQMVHRSRIHYELARTRTLSHQLALARGEAEKAIQIIESERLKVSDFDSRATYFASVHQYYQLYIDVLMRLNQEDPSRDYAQRAFEASEKSKMRSLLDMVAGPGDQSACDPAAALQSGSHSTPTGPDSCAPSSPSPLGLKEVEAELEGDNAILLEYELGPDTSQLWAIDDDQLFAYSLPGAARISKLATAFRNALTARQPLEGENAGHYGQRVLLADDRLADISHQLSQLLLGPVSGLLKRKRIIIVPDGPLRYIPFAVLPLPGSDHDQPLAMEHEIANLPSASILGALRQAARKRLEPTALAAIFADPVFSRDDPRFSGERSLKAPESSPVALGSALRDTGFGSGIIPRLPASRTEAQIIAKALSGNDILLALDFNASRNAVLAGNLGRYRYIHFATHGLLDSRHPEFSGLVLSLVSQSGTPQDGYLRIRDIYGLKLSADLVVLSSCNSALGKDLQSEGIIGLPRAFLYAGSQSVISSLWKVDDEASAALMKDFYSHLSSGETPAAALKKAQMALATDPRWQHPYYWAGFILQGEYR